MVLDLKKIKNAMFATGTEAMKNTVKNDLKWEIPIQEGIFQFSMVTVTVSIECRANKNIEKKKIHLMNFQKIWPSHSMSLLRWCESCEKRLKDNERKFSISEVWLKTVLVAKSRQNHFVTVASNTTLVSLVRTPLDEYSHFMEQIVFFRCALLWHTDWS